MRDGYLSHRYWGKRVGKFRDPRPTVFKSCRATAQQPVILDSYCIVKGKPKLERLPAIYTEIDDEAETLEIELKDNLSFLAIFSDHSVTQTCGAVLKVIK